MIPNLASLVTLEIVDTARCTSVTTKLVSPQCFKRQSVFPIKITPLMTTTLMAARCNYQPWWRHQMETFSALLAICAGNSPVSGEFPTQRPVTRSFDDYYDLCPNKRLSKQSWGWWFETRSRPLCRHRNDCFWRTPWGRIYCRRQMISQNRWYINIFRMQKLIRFVLVMNQHWFLRDFPEWWGGGGGGGGGVNKTALEVRAWMNNYIPLCFIQNYFCNLC